VSGCGWSKTLSSGEDEREKEAELCGQISIGCLRRYEHQLEQSQECRTILGPLLLKEMPQQAND